MKEIVKILNKKNKTISCMESCTGGMLASEITNVEGASNVFKLGLVTYSNKYKEYFGVSKKVIKEYTVYSNEVSKQMALNACKISNSDYSVGITGMLGTMDLNNKSDKINEVFITIYSKDNNKFYNYQMTVEGKTRLQKKKNIVSFVKEKLYGICK